MEEFICERRSTVSYRDGDIFRKYYKYAGESEIVLEEKFSNEALNNGINCPQFLGWGYSETKKMFFSEFEFIEIKTISKYLVDKSILKIALEQLTMMPTYTQGNDFRNELLEKELYSIIDYLPSDIQSEYVYLVKELFLKKNDVLIHGDYSFENIGWDDKKNTLIIFDFQNSGYGVRDWDRSYLLASIPNTYLVSTISDINIDLMKIITALKYGRGIRKKFELEERKRLYEYWWK